MPCDNCIGLLICFVIACICWFVSIIVSDLENSKLKKELDEYKTKDLIKSTIEEIVK